VKFRRLEWPKACDLTVRTAASRASSLRTILGTCLTREGRIPSGKGASQGRAFVYLVAKVHRKAGRLLTL
jgi:hypothetical protein